MPVTVPFYVGEADVQIAEEVVSIVVDGDVVAKLGIREFRAFSARSDARLKVYDAAKGNLVLPMEIQTTIRH